MFCSECGKHTAVDAKFCAHCGKSLTPPRPIDPVAAAASQESATNGGASAFTKPRVLVAVVVVVAALLTFLLTRGESENVASCKAEVQDMLTQPSTADWGKVTEREIPWDDDQYNGYTIVDDDGNPYPSVDYVVEGSVRSSNALGVMLLTNFRCERESWEDGWNIDLWEDGDTPPEL